VKRSMVVAVSVLACVVGGSAVVLGQGQGTLHEAAGRGDVAAVSQYVEKKANLNAADSRGYTPLRLAVDAYSIEVVKILLDGGANPNAKGSDGVTPLMAASISGQKDVVDALLAGKADLAAKNQSGWTALYCAVMMGQAEIVETLIKAGADVNATDSSGQTPLAVAQRRGNAEIVEILKQHGGTVPVSQDQYGAYGAGGMETSPVVGTVSQLPVDFVIDPNMIREQLRKVGALDAPLKAVDANSESEQRAWAARRSDNRTLLLRAVQKQFEDEMKFVKQVAVTEKAAKTIKAVDELVAARQNRYEHIGDELREQRRQTLQESRDTMATGRGRATTSRGTGRGRSSAGGYTGAAGQDAYATTTQTRTPRRPVAEVNEPPINADTQTQAQAWLAAQPESKGELLKTSHELDVIEYARLHEFAVEENAARTDAAIMGLLMVRAERIAKIEQKWMEEDERMQRMQERTGATGMQGTQPGMQQGTQQGARRGRR